MTEVKKDVRKRPDTFYIFITRDDSGSTDVAEISGGKEALEFINKNYDSIVSCYKKAQKLRIKKTYSLG